MLEDLAYRFQISKSCVSTIFQTWIDVMFIRLKHLIIWPSQKVVAMNKYAPDL